MYLFNEPNYDMYDEPFFGFVKGGVILDGENREELFIPESLVVGEFTDLIVNCVGVFNHYGDTQVSKSQWKMILNNSRRYGEVVQGIVRELEPWVNENFKENREFTIFGI